MSPPHLNRGRVLYNNFFDFTKSGKTHAFYTSKHLVQVFSQKHCKVANICQKKKITTWSELPE
jgi:hypothetical protein